MCNNVSEIVNKDLCVSCGACISVCSKGAIEFRFLKGVFQPRIDTTKCTNCGLCHNICPSGEIDNRNIYGELDINKKDLECYTLSSKDEDIRKNSASGGFVTTLILNLIEQGVYDKAYVLHYESFNDRERAVILPENEATKIKKAARSKYIPASIEMVIRDILNDSIGKAIVVCTPCQLLSIKKCISVFRKSEESLLFVGLFCERTLNYNIYDYYKYRFGTYNSLHFKDKNPNGWPGDTLLATNHGERVINKSVRMSLKPFFTLKRCLVCFDKLNQLADISCGDCYINGEGCRDGRSSIVARTGKGKRAFALCSDRFEFKNAAFLDIKGSQHLSFRQSEASGKLFNSVNPENLKDMELGTVSSRRNFKKIDCRLSSKNKNNKIERLARRLLKLFCSCSKQTKILIDNAGFENKGAQLMLISVVQQVKERMPDAQIVVPKSVFYENPSYCISNHIILLQKKCGAIKHTMLTYIYNNILNKNWYVTPQDIDVILDAGGFQFSDQWLPTEATVLAKDKYYASFTKKHRKIIFLPQAFGPFDRVCSQKLIQTVYKYADILFARENTSFTYLNNLFPDSGKIKSAPDFTCLCLPPKNGGINLPKGYVTIIPNSRMVTHTDTQTSQKYLPFLEYVIKFLLSKGERVVLLNHEGKDDELLIQKIASSFEDRVISISGCDAIEVKRIIRDSRLLISSRFHGVVSGLSQGIPTFCTSWSHKYEELLKEYGCAENVLDISNCEKAEMLISQNPISIKTNAIEEMKEKAAQLWDYIFAFIITK